MADGARQALVVEDDEDIRDLLSTLLTVLGFEVREASNGEIGLETLRTGWKPDLIVLDLMMPVMNGWAFRAEQRKIEGLREVPVIVLSARRPPYREAESGFEVAEILPKPFELDSFLAAVSRHCPEALERKPDWLGPARDLGRFDPNLPAHQVGVDRRSEGRLQGQHQSWVAVEDAGGVTAHRACVSLSTRCENVAQASFAAGRSATADRRPFEHPS